MRGGSRIKVNGGRGLGYKSSAGLMEGWLGKSKVKGEVYAKDKGGPGTCLRSKGVRGAGRKLASLRGRRLQVQCLGVRNLRGKVVE